MIWEKNGKICDASTFQLSWYKKNIMVPTPILLPNGRLRIFNTMCDENNVGRIGYIDVNANNPAEIYEISPKPVFDIGSRGNFDDNGVVVTSVMKHGKKYLMLYSGYQLCKSIPYFIFSGIAVSDDLDQPFERVSEIPLWDRVDGENCIRSAPYIIKVRDQFRVWYNADCPPRWKQNALGKSMPVYTIKTLSSDDIFDWPRQMGETCFEFNHNDEHALSTPTVTFENGIFKMIYSIRTFSKGYRLGYAESADGIHFERKDSALNVDVSLSGWDSEMMCFGCLFRFGSKLYLFYSGNGYGAGGMGYATLLHEE